MSTAKPDTTGKHHRGATKPRTRPRRTFPVKTYQATADDLKRFDQNTPRGRR